MDLLLLDDGCSLRGYDCRDVLDVSEIPRSGEAALEGAFLVRFGRCRDFGEIRCRRVIGFFSLTARDIRPLPRVLSERMAGEIPWGVGITEHGLCLLY